MGDEMYMGGVGVQERTRILSDRLWDAVLPAIFGSSAAVCVPFLYAMCLIGDPRAGGIERTWYWDIIVAVAVIAGIYFAAPWFRIHAELKRHRLVMEAETAKRGKGWALS